LDLLPVIEGTVYGARFFLGLGPAFEPIRRELVLENLALRHQLLVLSRSSRRPRLRPA
jgi:hypothetical protein